MDIHIAIEEKVKEGKRISFDEGLFLYEKGELAFALDAGRGVGEGQVVALEARTIDVAIEGALPVLPDVGANCGI